MIFVPVPRTYLNDGFALKDIPFAGRDLVPGAVRKHF
jgi:hypothetical protein